MSLAIYHLIQLVLIIIVFLFFLLIGIPLLLFVLWLLNKYNIIRASKKKRVWIAIGVNFLFIALFGGYIYLEPYFYDSTFAYTMRSNGISIPMYYVSEINYPKDKNLADDFGYDKKIKLVRSLSEKDVQKLKELVATDDRWTMKGDVYHFEESEFETETNIFVDIDLSKKIVTISYLNW